MRDVQVVAVPTRTNFRGITVREAALIHGPAGWGEFAPFLEYDDAEAVPWWRAAVEAADVGWPAPLRTRVPVNVTIPAVAADRAEQLVAEGGGCTTAKIKVADRNQTLADDVARVRAVRSALGSAGKIRIDVNGAWSLDEALAALPELDRAAGGLEYVEQPCASVPELAALRRRTDVLIAADESIRRSADPEAVVAADAADVLVLKVAPLGGVRACLEIAERFGLPVVVSSALDTAVGIAAGLALAAALPDLPYACGLATGLLLADDVVTDPATPVNGMLDVQPVVPDPDQLARLRPADARVEAWQERITRVERQLAGNS